MTGAASLSASLAAVSLPSLVGAGMVVQASEGPIQFAPPPVIGLGTGDPAQILRLLEYAGVHYQSPTSEAASLGIDVFKAGRQFALATRYERVAFDWDHTLDNYKIFESLFRLVHTKSSSRYPYGKEKEYPLTSLETARPFMHELAFGMMVGFAIRQGLKTFDQWEQYRPQVVLSTLTWPDRLGVLSRHIPLIALMDGRLPGREDTYERIVSSKTFVHLNDFLGYAERLLGGFRAQQFDRLTPAEQDAVIAYLRRGKGHYLKPLGAMREKWQVAGAMILFDDSHEVWEFFRQEAMIDQVTAVYTQNPYQSPGTDVGELDKVSLGLTRSARIRKAAQTLAVSEGRTVVQAVVRRLSLYERGNRSGQTDWKIEHLRPIPPGVVMSLHEVGTTLREFHDHYVAPTRRVKALIREILRDMGGLREAERLYASAVVERPPV